MSEKKAKVYKLDQYRKDAKIKPFELWLSDDEMISIDPPPTAAVITLAETPLTEVRLIMSLICGEHWNRIYEIVGYESFEIFQDLMIDLIRHFKLEGTADMPGGGRASRTS